MTTLATTRQKPSCPLAAGFVLNLLPIGAIVGGLAAVAFATVRPLLLFLGLCKAVEFLRCKTINQS